MQQMRIAVGISASVCLTACSPSFAPPNAPSVACQAITKEQFDNAKDAGATIGRGKINAIGAASLAIGPGTSHCTKVPSGKRTCIRSNDFAIEYKLNDDRLFYVLIPKKTQYRFNVTARPTPCEVIVASQ